MDKRKKHEKICEELGVIYSAKNADYGDSFGETFEKLGIISAVTRIADKTNRLQTLAMQAAKVEDEKIEDTLMDYAIMTLIELDHHESKSEQLEFDVFTTNSAGDKE